MKNVKLLTGPLLIGDRHFEKDQVISMPRIKADKMIRQGHAVAAADGEVPVNEFNPLHDVVDPLVANADPLHAARALSLNIADGPGLLAHAEATGAPKRAGRMAPEATTTVDAIPETKQAAKPAKA